jgi:hypothetical protein
MKNLIEIKNTLSTHKQHLVDKYGLKFIAVFGSYGRGEQTLNSDVDILVDFDKPIGIEFIDLANELENILNCKIDLVSKNGIKPKYMKYIEEDLVYV